MLYFLIFTFHHKEKLEAKAGSQINVAIARMIQLKTHIPKNDVTGGVLSRLNELIKHGEGVRKVCMKIAGKKPDAKMLNSCLSDVGKLLKDYKKIMSTGKPMRREG